jgi:hypothetical protein
MPYDFGAVACIAIAARRFFPFLVGGWKGTPHHRHPPATSIIVRGLPGKPVPEADSGGVTPPPKIPAVGGSMRFENFMEGGLAGNPPSQK